VRIRRIVSLRKKRREDPGCRADEGEKLSRTSCEGIRAEASEKNPESLRFALITIIDSIRAIVLRSIAL
jgi:hypothetical protein